MIIEKIMRTNVLGTIVLLCMLAVFTSCGSKTTGNTNVKESTVDQFEPDPRFATIDTLVYVLTETLSDSSLNELEQHYEEQSLAMKSYWYLNHKGGDESRIDEDVCNDLKVLADSLSGGSTFDMMQSCQIACAVARYLTAKDYCCNYSKNPLYQAEMRDWLVLEEELQEFYCTLASLANWGGSIVTITTSSAMAELAEARQADYAQLTKDGHHAGDEGMTTNEARANLIQEMEDAKSLEDDQTDKEYTEAVMKLCKSCDKVTMLLDKWLKSRNKLCEAEGIPESHTAQFIAQLSQLIMEYIEG